jgi:hypothetical protein
VLIAVELEPVLVGDLLAGLHTQERVVGFGVGLMDVVAVVRGEEGRVQPLREPQEHRVRAPLLVDAMVLQLDEERVAAEDVLEPSGGAERLFFVVAAERLEHESTEAAARRDDALVMLVEQLPVTSRAVVVSGEERLAGQPNEVAVALGRLGERSQVVVELLTALDVAPEVVDLRG